MTGPSRGDGVATGAFPDACGQTASVLHAGIFRGPVAAPVLGV